MKTRISIFSNSLLIGAAVACLSLFGCSRTDNQGQTTGGMGGDTSSTTRRGGTTDTAGTYGGGTGTATGTTTDTAGMSTRRGGENTGMGSASSTEPSSDSPLVQRIKKSLASDNSFSGVNWDNIRITELNGTVTLRGPVTTQREKDDIESRIKGMVGVDKVENQLEVTNSEK